MRTQWEGVHLPSGKRVFLRTQLCWHPDLRILASRTVRNECRLLKPPSVWYHGSQSRPRQRITNKYRNHWGCGKSYKKRGCLEEFDTSVRGRRQWSHSRSASNQNLTKENKKSEHKISSHCVQESLAGGMWYIPVTQNMRLVGEMERKIHSKM